MVTDDAANVSVGHILVRAAPVFGDFDDDRELGFRDIDLLSEAIRQSSDDMAFDLSRNGILDAVPDALHLLRYAFLPGSPPPLCLEAVDTNDNGIFQNVADAIFLLNCAFVAGTPCMAAPYPDCGVDPNPESSLGCTQTVCP